MIYNSVIIFCEKYQFIMISSDIKSNPISHRPSSSDIFKIKPGFVYFIHKNSVSIFRALSPAFTMLMVPC